MLLIPKHVNEASVSKLVSKPGIVGGVVIFVGKGFTGNVSKLRVS